MSDNENEIKTIFDAFQKGDLVTLQFTTKKDQDEEWFFKHMQPKSVSWNAKKGGYITVNCHFEKYKPTTWELFKDWLHSKIFRHERYW